MGAETSAGDDGQTPVMLARTVATQRMDASVADALHVRVEQGAGATDVSHVQHGCQK